MDIFGHLFNRLAFESWLKTTEGNKRLKSSLERNALYQSLKNK